MLMMVVVMEWGLWKSDVDAKPFLYVAKAGVNLEAALFLLHFQHLDDYFW